MALSNDLISQFVKATKDSNKTLKETIVYGTVQKDIGYVKLDGSDVLTPVKTTIVIAENDRVTVLLRNHEAVVTGNVSSPAARNEDTLKIDDLEAQNAKINSLIAANVIIQDTLKTNNADITNLKTSNATINRKLTAAEASIKNLTTEKLSAKDIEGKYANIDFSNITKATMKEFYAGSGIIKDVVLQNGVITGELSGITISGDLIKANTLIANKLVIQGEDGLYYRLNTDGKTVETEQTDQNSLNGTVIQAKSVTASKINVTDLQAFGATIGGFKISEKSIYSGAKSSPTNTTRGIYLGSDGQLYIGDATNYIKYTIDSNGNSKLQISADIIDSAGNACFEAKNSNGDTVIGYARYVNSGDTNIYGGTELNLFAKSGGAIVANSPFVPKSNSSLALGKAGSLGWSNIYIGNESGVYNGLRMIVGGSNENLCGRDENGRYIFGNNGSVMYYRAKNVDTTTTGNAFKFTSGNDIASNNTTSVWLFGGADSTSRFIGSYMAYNRKYSSAANMYVTANGLFGRSTSSSQRYKEDITVADLSCFSGLYNLPVKKFKYKSGYLCGEDERYGQYLYGFVVEDLVDILPCAVDHITDENGNSVPEMWNSNIIIPALLKLIQDLNGRLTIIEEQNTSIETALNTAV